MTSIPAEPAMSRWEYLMGLSSFSWCWSSPDTCNTRGVIGCFVQVIHYIYMERQGYILYISIISPPTFSTTFFSPDDRRRTGADAIFFYFTAFLSRFSPFSFSPLFLFSPKPSVFIFFPQQPFSPSRFNLLHLHTR